MSSSPEGLNILSLLALIRGLMILAMMINICSDTMATASIFHYSLANGDSSLLSEMINDAISLNEMTGSKMWLSCSN